MSCRHRDTWLIASGYLEWCWRCGALRELFYDKDYTLIPTSYWVRPTATGKNPYDKWKKRSEKHRQRMRR